MSQGMVGFWTDSSISWTVQATCTSLQTDTSSLYFYRPDALPHAQATLSKHWRYVLIYVGHWLLLRCQRRRHYHQVMNWLMSLIQLPEITRDADDSRRSKCLSLLLDVVGLSLGVVLMMTIAFYEHSIQSLLDNNYWRHAGTCRPPSDVTVHKTAVESR